MRDVMTPEQVAEYLQVNTETVYRLIRGRQLAAAKVGRVYRILRTDVDAFLRERATRPDPDVRRALVERVAEIARRRTAEASSRTSDDILAELEAMDEAARSIPPLRA